MSSAGQEERDRWDASKERCDRAQRGIAATDHSCRST